MASSHTVVQGDTGPVARCKSLRTSRQADAQEIFNAPLPVEVVLHIFSHLSARELCHVAAVSWSWNILSSHDSLWKPLVHSKGTIVHESEPGSDGRLGSMTWKEMFLDLREEYLCRIPQREAEAQEQLSKWECRAACGMRAGPPTLPRRPVPNAESVALFAPFLGWKEHPNASNRVVNHLSDIDLEASASSLYKFLYSVDNLFSSESSKAKINACLKRYHSFMQLKAKHPDLQLIPTFDIEVIWQSHLIRPSMYSSDLDRLFNSPVISHKLIATHHEVSLHAKALEQTRDLWRQEFGSEYLYDLDAALPQVPPYFVDDFLSASVEKRGTRQTFQSSKIEKLDGSEGSSWVNPMSLKAEHIEKDLMWYRLFQESEPNMYCDSSAIGRFVKSYERFLYMTAVNFQNNTMSRMAHPTYAIDLIWHTHMLHPQEYLADCSRLLGTIADHSPWPEDYEEANFAATSSSWESLFGIKMSEESKTGPWKESEADGDTFCPPYW